MRTLPEQPRWWLRDHDLPDGFHRAPDYCWVNLQAERFVHVNRRNARRLRGPRRERAIVASRNRRNYRPLSFEGSVVRNVLEECQWAPYNDVVRAVELWAQGQPEEFIHRAVNDRGALLSILVRVDE